MDTPATVLPVSDLDLPRQKQINFRLWMLFLGMCTYGAFYTGRQNFGIAAAALRADLHLSAIQIGTISGSMLIAYAAGSLASGYLADRIDARWIVCTGALFSLLLNWATSFAVSYRQVLVLWACNGIAQALGWAPCSSLVTSWWPQSKRATVFGVVLFAAGIASLATYAISLESLTLFGWRYVFRLPVLSLAPMIVLFLIFARRGSAHLEEEIANPHERLAQARGLVRYLPLLRNIRFLSFCASIGFESLARYGLLIWVPIHLLGRDWKGSGAGHWLMLSLPLGMALGALSTGYVSDRLFRSNRVIAIIVQMLGGAVLVAALYLVPRTDLMLSYTLLLLAGFAVYGPQAAYWTVGMEVGGTEHRGIALGMMDSCAYICAALGETVIGWMVDKTGTTLAIFPTIACACLLAAMLAVPMLRQIGKIA